jgi:O-acetyl-ADP-ribose deacetylase (regulator of RNase III)
MTFKLILSAINEDLFKAFKKHFAKFPQVQVVFAPFEQTEFDCVVSAANSFGLMDGGVDQCITDYFGVQMMKRVQQEVLNQYYGEQPVGTSMIVRGTEITDKEGQIIKTKYVAHTPTMRIPMDINKTSNVYAAMKAMLIAVEQHNKSCITNVKMDLGYTSKINTVVCPGLGTNAGRVPAEEAAKMMSLALHHFLNPPKAIDWYFATTRHGEIQNREIGDELDKIDMSLFES